VCVCVYIYIYTVYTLLKKNLHQIVFKIHLFHTKYKSINILTYRFRLTDINIINFLK